MARNAFVVAVLATAFLGWNGRAAAQAPAREGLVERVNKAIDAGVRFLRDKERGTGDWDHLQVGSIPMPGGWTALATLALLNSGVRPDDQIIDRALRYLRPIEPNMTYVVSLQTMVFAEAGRSEDRERIQRNVDWLVQARVMAGGKCRGWGYGSKVSNLTDNSNTQYALLGLHAGRQAGATIDRAVWESIRAYYLDSQHPDGAWHYSADRLEGRLTMTTAGLCGLVISGMELNQGREKLQPDGSATNCGVYEENEPAARALGWINEHLTFEDRIRLQGAVFYNLYGIERTGRLTGERFLGDYDWYRVGAEFLVRPGKQHDDGSWSQPDPHDQWPVVSTSFALLFLSKGRIPVLISKLVHGPDNDWNNDRNDARNLVEYASRELFRRKPMAWQVFNARRVQVANNNQLAELAGELGKSPIVYFNGHLEPRFTDVEEELLKRHIDQGGFLFAEACCGRKEFDSGFRALMHKLFPDNELKPLPPEHPIWRAHAFVPPGSFPLEGIDYGCKTVVVYSPKDLSCFWESNLREPERGQLAFRMGGNIIAYATGLEPPPPRLSQAEVLADDPQSKQIRRGILKVAQLRHEGDWQPAPNAMRHLLADLRVQAHLDVDLQTKAIVSTDRDLVNFKFLYMHGRGTFQLAPNGVKNLRATLDTGGTLLADACCGKKAFDTSFRELAGQLFPGSKLEPIPASDDLYSKDVNGVAISTVRCRTEASSGTGAAGEFREAVPALEGIRVGNHWAVIYSKYDIGCALEKHQSTDCIGYDHASALLLGKAAVLYAFRH